MISRRDGFDAQESRILNAAAKNKVANQIVAAHLNCDERHTHLKRDAGFLRQNLYRPTLFDPRYKFSEQLTKLFALARKVRLQSDVTARVCLVAISETPAALGAPPKR